MKNTDIDTSSTLKIINTVSELVWRVAPAEHTARCFHLSLKPSSATVLVMFADTDIHI